MPCLYSNDKYHYELCGYASMKEMVDHCQFQVL